MSPKKKQKAADDVDVEVLEAEAGEVEEVEEASAPVEEAAPAPAAPAEDLDPRDRNYIDIFLPKS